MLYRPGVVHTGRLQREVFGQMRMTVHRRTYGRTGKGKLRTLHTGASIPPEAMMHFPPVSDFHPVLEIVWTFWKISEMLPFPDKISYFHPPKFLTTFFVINQKFRISPPVSPI